MQQFTFQTIVDMSVYGMRSIRQNNRKNWGKRHLDLKNKPVHLSLVKWPVEGQRTFTTIFTTPGARKVASVDTLKVKFVISIPTVVPNRTEKNISKMPKLTPLVFRPLKSTKNEANSPHQTGIESIYTS